MTIIYVRVHIYWPELNQCVSKKVVVKKVNQYIFGNYSKKIQGFKLF